MMNLKFIFLFFILMVIQIHGFPLVPQDYLDQLNATTMIQIKSSVLMIDYDLLKADFPHLRGESDDAIQQWLLGEVSFMRYSQVNQNAHRCKAGQCIHKPFSIPSPPLYRDGFTSHLTRRSVLMPVQSVPGAYFDVKGSGASEPYPGGLHINGVLDLRFAISDFIFSKIFRGIQRVVPPEDHFEFVDSYAVLYIPSWFWSEKFRIGASPDDLPDDVLPRSPTNRQDVGLLIRRPVVRPLVDDDYLAPLHWQIKFETLLRRFSLTSTFHYSGWFPKYKDELLYWDAQMCGEHKVFVDFNAYHYLTHEMLHAQAGKPVYHPRYWFSYNSSENIDLACIDFPTGNVNIALVDCVPNVLKYEPDWHIPPVALLPDVYQLDFQRIFWSDLVNDFTPLYNDEADPEKYYDLLVLTGLTDLVRAYPMLFQELFHRLEARLASWPPIPYDMLHEAENTLIL